MFNNNEEARKKILNNIFNANLNIENVQKKSDLFLQQNSNENGHYTNLFHTENEELGLLFAKEFNLLGGHFVYCEDELICFQKMKKILQTENINKLYCNDYLIRQKLQLHQLETYLVSDLLHSQVSITNCDMLIARTGTIVISTLGIGDRVSSVFSPIHFCIAYNHQVIYDFQDALKYFKKKLTYSDSDERASFFSFITGPSKTADIEKTLVKGVHGPENVFVFFIDK